MSRLAERNSAGRHPRPVRYTDQEAAGSQACTWSSTAARKAPLPRVAIMPPRAAAWLPCAADGACQCLIACLRLLVVPGAVTVLGSSARGASRSILAAKARHEHARPP